MQLSPVHKMFSIYVLALCAHGSPERGTEMPQTEPSVSESTETNAWTEPVELNEIQNLDDTHTHTPDTHTHHSPVIHTHQSPEPDISLEPAQNLPLCEDENLTDYRSINQLSQRNLGEMQFNNDDNETMDHCNQTGFSCLLYPGNQLNCSWMFHHLPDDRQYSASVSVCKDIEQISTVDCLSKEGGGTVDEGVQLKDIGSCYGEVDGSLSSVILSVTVSLPDVWCLYNSKYDIEDIEILSPPPNITALLREGGLLVQWEVPFTRSYTSPSCFVYQLEKNGLIKEEDRECKGTLNYKEPITDPTLAHEVRIRTQMGCDCGGVSTWSEWSDIYKVAPSEWPNEPNLLTIVGIALGIPMILLALLLLLRTQRVYERLFPPIPRPSLKIKILLEREDLFQFFPPVLPSEYVEKVSEVEEAEATPEKMLI